MWKGLRELPSGVILGDCLKAMPRLPTGSVDLILTDPPYLVNYRARDGRSSPNDRDESWLDPAYRQMYRLLKRDAFLVSFYGWFKVHRFMEAWLAAGFRPVGDLAWTKPYRSNPRHVLGQKGQKGVGCLFFAATRGVAKSGSELIRQYSSRRNCWVKPGSCCGSR
jgi:DNA modification methylase